MQNLTLLRTGAYINGEFLLKTDRTLDALFVMYFKVRLFFPLFILTPFASTTHLPCTT